MKNVKNWTEWDNESRKLIIGYYGSNQAEKYFVNNKFTKFMNDIYNEGKTPEQMLELIWMNKISAEDSDSDKFYIA